MTANNICEHCKGKGIYAVEEKYSDGDSAIMWYECNYCHGTGQDPDPEEGEDFDIGGSSLLGGEDDD